jgi:hypothetical protein
MKEKTKAMNVCWRPQEFSIFCDLLSVAATHTKFFMYHRSHVNIYFICAKMIIVSKHIHKHDKALLCVAGGLKQKK